MILLFVLLIIISAVVELLSVMAVFYFQDFSKTIIIYLDLHGLASILLSIGLYPFIYTKFYRSKLRTFLYTFLFSFLLLLPGYIITLIFGIFIVRLVKYRGKVLTEGIPVADLFLEEAVAFKKRYGEGFVFKAINSPYRDTKESVIFLLSEIKNPLAITLLKKATYIDDDEVRLLALSNLSRLEKELNSKLHKLIKKAEETENPKEKGILLKEIAMLYWEFVYLNISDEEFQRFYIEQAKNYALDAVSILKDDYQLYFLLGKIFLKEKNIEKAEEYLKKSILLNPQDESVYTYLAEISFIKNDYKQTKTLLQKIRNINYNYLAYSIVSLWKEA